MPLLDLFDHTGELTESFQVKHWRFLKGRAIWCGRITGPTGRNGSMIAIEVPNDQIGISTSTNANDFHLLTTEWMMRMDDGHPSRNSWG